MRRRVSDGGYSVRCLLTILLLAVASSACGESFEPPLPPRGKINYPVGLAVHPEGRFLYVVNSNFNARYRADSGGTVSVVDTRSLEILKESTPFLPSFGGAIELNDDASRAYVAAREGNRLVAFHVAQEDGPAPAGGALFCLDDDDEPTSDPEPCSLQRVPKNTAGARLSSDPFDLAVTTIRREEPDTGNEVPIDLINISYLGSNRVSTISAPNRSLEAASIQTAALLPGGNRIAQRPGTLNYYVAGRNSHLVARFSPFINFQTAGSFGEVEALFRQGEIVLSNFVNSQTGGRISVDARGLAFDDSGEMLYVATRRPDALHVFELVAQNPATGGGLEHRLTATIPIADNPSDALVHDNPEGRRLVYVPSFQDESINVVDTDSKTLVDVIELDAGPHEMVIDTAANRCTTPGETCRAYVSLFDDAAEASEQCGPESKTCGSVAVIDLDPASPRYHRVIRKIR